MPILQKTLSQLLQDAQNPQPGYQIHHIVEQTPARQEGFPNAQVDGPDNLVRIPTLKHWQITGWYGVPNDEFGGLSPERLSQGQELGRAYACRKRCADVIRSSSAMTRVKVGTM